MAVLALVLLMLSGCGPLPVLTFTTGVPGYSGIVRQAGSGEGIAGVVVSWGCEETETDDEGRFRIERQNELSLAVLSPLPWDLVREASFVHPSYATKTAEWRDCCDSELGPADVHIDAGIVYLYRKSSENDLQADTPICPSTEPSKPVEQRYLR